MTKRPGKQMKIKVRTGLWFIACLLAPSPWATASPPLADVHLHWKENQREVTRPEEAIATLRSQNVALAVVTGTPPELALELADLAPDFVVPIYGIYRIPGDWANWHHDTGLLSRTRDALASGRYRGIGEVHMIGGFISDWRNPVISGLFQLGAEFDVPVLVHTEFSRANYFAEFCAAFPQTRFLWAHAGSILPPGEVARVLDDCSNVWVELSALDPWRHRSRPIADASGALLPEWKALVLKYSDRLMIGSDPVWPVEQLNPWDEPDTGWQQLGRFLDFHRHWLEDLPADLAERIRIQNARALFISDTHPPIATGTARSSE